MYSECNNVCVYVHLNKVFMVNTFVPFDVNITIIFLSKLVIVQPKGQLLLQYLYELLIYFFSSAEFFIKHCVFRVFRDEVILQSL